MSVRAIAELDGKVYVSVTDSGGAYHTSLMYDSNKDHRYLLPQLWGFGLVTVPDRNQLVAVGGNMNSNDVVKVTNKVFLWDEKNMKWLTPYPDMPTTRHSPTWYSSVLQQNQVENLGNI